MAKRSEEVVTSQETATDDCIAIGDKTENRQQMRAMSRETIRKQIARAKRITDCRKGMGTEGTKSSPSIQQSPTRIKGRLATDTATSLVCGESSDLKSGSSTNKDKTRLREYWELVTAVNDSSQQQSPIRKPTKPVKRWWSVDALSATLIATKDLVDRPVPYSNSTHYVLDQRRTTNRSVNSKMALSPETRSWCDIDQIHDSVSRESIANTNATKSKWERQHSDAERSTDSSTSKTERRTTRPTQLPSYTNMVATYDTSPVNRLQQLQEANFNVIQRDIQENQRKELEIKLQQMPRQVDAQLEQQKYLLTCYFAQHPDVLRYMGLELPATIRTRLRDYDELTPRVELYTVDTKTAQSPQPYQKSGETAENVGILEYDDGSLKSRNGRYVKRSTPTQRAIGRKQYSSETSSPPQSTIAHRPTPHDGSNITTVAVCPMKKELKEEKISPSRGESLIAREIREQREREEDLRRSRSELGLPQLDDVLDFWRHGAQPRRAMPPLRTHSMDRLHHDYYNHYSSSPPTTTPVNVVDGGTNHFTNNYNGGSMDQLAGFVSVGAATLPLSSARVGGGFGGGKRRQTHDAFLDGGADCRPVSAASDYANQRHHLTADDDATSAKLHIPIETRIEQEMMDLQRRENELKEQRKLAKLDDADLSEADSGTSSGDPPTLGGDFDRAPAATNTIARYTRTTPATVSQVTVAFSKGNSPLVEVV